MGVAGAVGLGAVSAAAFSGCVAAGRVGAGGMGCSGQGLRGAAGRGAWGGRVVGGWGARGGDRWQRALSVGFCKSARAAFVAGRGFRGIVVVAIGRCCGVVVVRAVSGRGGHAAGGGMPASTCVMFAIAMGGACPCVTACRMQIVPWVLSHSRGPMGWGFAASESRRYHRLLAGAETAA